MDFIDRINELAARIPKQLDYCTTEEATKNALVLPFINALGYDIFNPTEVLPEFTADVGIKKGEKVDYAILQNGKPIMLFECKWSGADLSKAHVSQLYRYFNVVPDVRFGILTNGVEYWFYTDLDKPNVMDDGPFFRFNIVDFQPRHVDELKKFTKSTFDLENILNTASELKYTAAITAIVTREFEQPSEEFVVFLSKQVYSGRMTQAAKEQFAEITQKALKRFISEQINQRLQSAMQEAPTTIALTQENSEEESVSSDEELDEAVVRVDREKGIVTTEEEIEGFFAIKSILRDVIDHRRVHMRDTKSYCGILLDDNNRKPICRLHFNRDQNFLGIIDATKKEQRVPINDIDDIYAYADQIIATAKSYDTVGTPLQSGGKETRTGTIRNSQSKFTGKQVVAVHFQGQRYLVDTWKDGLLAVLALLREQKPAQFETVAPTMRGRTKPYITRESAELRTSERIPSTPFYVETNLSSESIVRLCYKMLSELGYPESTLAFETV